MELKEHRDEVTHKYDICILKASRTERSACRERFRSDESVLKLLSSRKLGDRLHPAIVQVMDKLKEDWEPEKVATAFDAMESYVVNLIEYPWKKEFHTILLYSGFYKTLLEPNLQQPRLLLRIVGYETAPGDRLFLVKGVPTMSVLLDAAVDFFLAATECRVILSIVSKVELSTPVEVYWMRRADSGDRQMCIDKLTLSRKPLPPDSEKILGFESAEVDRHLTKVSTGVRKRGGSPYDNVMSTDNSSMPQYGILVGQSSNIVPPRHDLRSEVQLSEPLSSTFSGFQPPIVTMPYTRSPLPTAGLGVLQHRSPDVPPPVYAAAKDMPSARLQNISYGQPDDVDMLAALLKDVNPRVMENPAHRQQIMSKLGTYSGPGSDSCNDGKLELTPVPKSLGQQVPNKHVVAAVKGWQCPKCTYFNAGDNEVCEMCG